MKWINIATWDNTATWLNADTLDVPLLDTATTATRTLVQAGSVGQERQKAAIDVKSLLSFFAITTIDGDITGSLTTVNISPVGEALIKSGHTLMIIDTQTMTAENVTVSADVGASDTSISISSHSFSNIVQDGSYILMDMKSIIRLL